MGDATRCRHALHTDGGTTYAHEVVDGATVRTEGTVGAAFGTRTEATSGLEDGDRVEVQADVPARGWRGPGLPGRRPDGGPGGVVVQGGPR